MKRYMLDTGICIYIIKQRPEKVFDKFRECKIGQICISIITYAELQYGAQNSSKPRENLAVLNKFLGPIDIIEYNADAAIEYGRVRKYLKDNGMPIGGNDMFLASHVIAHDCIMVTNNVRHFSKVPNLELDNWA